MEKGHRRGFTLVEVMIVMLLFSMLLLMIFPMRRMAVWVLDHARTQEQAEMLGDAAWRYVADRLETGAVEVEELEDFTLQMAHHISEKAPLAIAVIKEELRVLGEAHTMNSDEFERIQGMRRAVYDSEDYQEGMNAFLEKRKPNFVGHKSLRTKE